ncbi:MAG TPA: CDP-glycerol glycerophosphotransferase family protein, partial [Segetibacter sp.]
MVSEHRKRILIPIVGQGSIIHIIRTGMLDKLSGFCEPVIGLLWDQPDLISELKSKGYEVYLIPEYKVSAEYNQVKSKIDFWYRKYRVKTPSVNIQKNYIDFFKKKTTYSYIKKVKDALHYARLKIQPEYINRLLSKEALLITQQQSFPLYKKWINDHKIEGLFTVTPFLSEADLFARILREADKKIIASIHSFDNVTKRGWASTFFDHYIVWNKYNKNELERIHPPLKENNSITIAGAPQFDFHFNQDFSWSKEEWLTRLNLPKDKKIILYAGGSVVLLPNEPQYLKHLH